MSTVTPQIKEMIAKCDNPDDIVAVENKMTNDYRAHLKCDCGKIGQFNKRWES